MPQTAGICGVILAAGESTRMGRDKALLPWPPVADGAPAVNTFLGAMIDLLQQHSDLVIVVAGKNIDELRARRRLPRGLRRRSIPLPSEASSARFRSACATFSTADATPHSSCRSIVLRYCPRPSAICARRFSPRIPTSGQSCRKSCATASPFTAIPSSSAAR